MVSPRCTRIRYPEMLNTVLSSNASRANAGKEVPRRPFSQRLMVCLDSFVAIASWSCESPSRSRASLICFPRFFFQFTKTVLLISLGCSQQLLTHEKFEVYYYVHELRSASFRVGKNSAMPLLWQRNGRYVSQFQRESILQ